MSGVQNEEVAEKIPVPRDFFPKELTRATWLSRCMTLTLLFVLPIVGFWMGYEKGKQTLSYNTEIGVFTQNDHKTEPPGTTTITSEDKFSRELPLEPNDLLWVPVGRVFAGYLPDESLEAGAVVFSLNDDDHAPQSHYLSGRLYKAAEFLPCGFDATLLSPSGDAWEFQQEIAGVSWQGVSADSMYGSYLGYVKLDSDNVQVMTIGSSITRHNECEFDDAVAGECVFEWCPSTHVHSLFVSDTYKVPELNAMLKQKSVPGQMVLIIYTQDKKIASVSDCGATKPVAYTVPVLTSIEEIIDRSLDILFADDLPSWMSYESVNIFEGVATLKVSFEYAPSSCESMHFLSVIVDTLTQYDEIEVVYFDVGDGVALEFPF